MPDKTLHDTLIDEILDYRTVLTPREAAAAWEIRVLRAKIEKRPVEEIVQRNIAKPITKTKKKPVTKAKGKGK